MMKFIKTLSGFLSTVLGMFIVLPRLNQAVWPVQLMLNEFPWVVTGFGLWAALKKPRSTLGTGFGLFGAVLSCMPYLFIQRALDDMRDSMRDGLGEDYESMITWEMRKRMSPVRWSLKTTLGGRYLERRVSIIRDIVFEETPDRPLRLDVYRPLTAPADGERLYPAVIVVHGGGWRHGDKGGYFAGHNRYLAAQGYVVFDVQYRFTTTDSAPWPAQLDDVRAAIRWVKAQARTYRLDVSRIALMGRSAGGQLALQAAYRSQGAYEDTQVAAVVAYYAPTNLRVTGPQHDERVLNLLGATSYENPSIYADASPLDFACEGVPPTLLIHGGMDAIVSPIHAELLLNQLKAVKTPAVVLRVPWARHAFDISMGGMGSQFTQYHVDRFLAWCLYKGHIQ